MLIYVRVFVLMIAITLGLAKKCIVTTSGGTVFFHTYTDAQFCDQSYGNTSGTRAHRSDLAITARNKKSQACVP